MRAWTVDVMVCDSRWRAEKTVEFYAQPTDVPGFGEERLTFRVVEENGQWVVRGYSAVVLEELGA